LLRCFIDYLRIQPCYWKTLKTDADAKFDEEINFDASDIEPMITYGTRNGIGISKSIPTLKMLLKEKKLMLNLWVIWGSNKVKP
jgi:homoaconitase/3-isopropylmalate dehydratase large subunit